MDTNSCMKIAMSHVPELLFHNLSLKNPGVVILDNACAIRENKQTLMDGKAW